MTDHEDDDDLVLTPPEGMEIDEPEDDPDADTPEGDEDGEDEFTIELEGEEAQDETPLIKQLREQIRERDKRLSVYQKTEAPKIEVGPEPDMADDDVDYDQDKFKEKWRAWDERRRKAEAQESEQAQANAVREQENQRRLISYKAQAAALPVKDFDAAESAVVSALPEIHQSALLAYTDNPAKMVYALARHPQMLDKLANEPDPIKAIIMARDMERNLKVTQRKRPPAPESETIQRGSARPGLSSDKELERLEKEADRTGDRTKLIAYRSKMKKAA